MKSIFLYEDINGKFNKPNLPGMYQFDCCNLVGIDTLKIDKKDRTSIVNSFNLREFHVLQRWFAELIYYANNIGLIISNLQLVNIDESSYEWESICENISSLITRCNYPELLDYLIELNKEYGSEIKSLSFICNSAEYKMTATGILETFSTDSQLEKCINNKDLWVRVVGQK